MSKKDEAELKRHDVNVEDLKQDEKKSVSCECEDTEEKKRRAKAIAEKKKQCEKSDPKAMEKDEPESLAVQAERLRVKQTKVLEGPNKTPTEAPADEDAD